MKADAELKGATRMIEDARGAFNFVIAVAGPYGAGCTSLCEELSKVVSDWPGCVPVRISASDIIEKWYPIVCPGKTVTREGRPSHSRRAFQQAGTEMRRIDGEIIGKLIVGAIHTSGKKQEVSAGPTIRTLVFLVDSLKNRNDLAVLKRVYGSELLFCFVHADRERRWQRLRNYKGWTDPERLDFVKCDLRGVSHFLRGK